MNNWRDIAGNPGYQVSDAGMVRSIGRTILRNNRCGRRGTFCLRGRILKTYLVGDGYVGVALGAGKSNKRYVHRLVANAFLPPPARVEIEVNHRDGNKSNNATDNLGWVSRRENQIHAVRILGVRGGQFGPSRERCAAGARA